MHKTILLVENNPVDEALKLRVLRKHNIANDGITEAVRQLGISWLLVNEPPPAVP